MSSEPTTLALPSDLPAARESAEARRSAVDAEFRYRAEDADYQREVHQILAEFAQADAETLRETPQQR